MDHPLDLSNQTEMDGSKQYEDMESETEQVCQFQNCSCPKKHLTILESPKVRTQTRNMTQLNYSTHAPPTGNGTYKRPVSADTDNMTQVHPKRRKIERVKHTLGKSSSDTDLQSHGAFESDNQQNTYHAEIKYGSSQDNWERGNLAGNTGDLYQKSREMDNSMYYDNPMASIWQNKEIEQQQQRERSKTVSHIERLPKKRAYARNLSLENEHKGRSAVSAAAGAPTGSQYNPVISKNVPSCSKRSIPYQSDRMDSSPSSDDSSSQDSLKNAPSNGKKPSSQPARELTEKEKAYMLLKADIMREIDNDKEEEEDVSIFRKNLLKRAMGAAGFTTSPANTKKPTKEAEKEENKPGESRITALDYLMSKQLLETEDQAFKPRNHHIHQIINGEKPGQLCLMDIVELQVEVGLA